MSRGGSEPRFATVLCRDAFSVGVFDRSINRRSSPRPRLASPPPRLAPLSSPRVSRRPRSPTTPRSLRGRYLPHQQPVQLRAQRLEQHRDARRGSEPDPSVHAGARSLVIHLHFAAEEQQRVRADHRRVAYVYLRRSHLLVVQKEPVLERGRAEAYRRRMQRHLAVALRAHGDFGLGAAAAAAARSRRLRGLGLRERDVRVQTGAYDRAHEGFVRRVRGREFERGGGGARRPTAAVSVAVVGGSTPARRRRRRRTVSSSGDERRGGGVERSAVAARGGFIPRFHRRVGFLLPVVFVFFFFPLGGASQHPGPAPQEPDLIEKLDVLLPHLADLLQRLRAEERLGEKIALEPAPPRARSDPPRVGPHERQVIAARPRARELPLCLVRLVPLVYRREERRPEPHARGDRQHRVETREHRAVENHLPEPRVHRQLREVPPQRRELVRGVHRVELRERRERGRDGLLRRRLDRLRQKLAHVPELQHLNLEAQRVERRA
eukprot:30812-Pelagococcus_subviridis.AAC.2